MNIPSKIAQIEHLALIQDELNEQELTLQVLSIDLQAYNQIEQRKRQESLNQEEIQPQNNQESYRDFIQIAFSLFISKIERLVEFRKDFYGNIYKARFTLGESSTALLEEKMKKHYILQNYREFTLEIQGLYKLITTLIKVFSQNKSGLLITSQIFYESIDKDIQKSIEFYHLHGQDYFQRIAISQQQQECGCSILELYIKFNVFLNDVLENQDDMIKIFDSFHINETFKPFLCQQIIRNYANLYKPIKKYKFITTTNDTFKISMNYFSYSQDDSFKNLFSMISENNQIKTIITKNSVIIAGILERSSYFSQNIIEELLKLTKEANNIEGYQFIETFSERIKLIPCCSLNSNMLAQKFFYDTSNFFPIPVFKSMIEQIEQLLSTDFEEFLSKKLHPSSKILQNISQNSLLVYAFTKILPCSQNEDQMIPFHIKSIEKKYIKVQQTLYWLTMGYRIMLTNFVEAWTQKYQNNNIGLKNIFRVILNYFFNNLTKPFKLVCQNSLNSLERNLVISDRNFIQLLSLYLQDSTEPFYDLTIACGADTQQLENAMHSILQRILLNYIVLSSAKNSQLYTGQFKVTDGEPQTEVALEYIDFIFFQKYTFLFLDYGLSDIIKGYTDISEKLNLRNDLINLICRINQSNTDYIQTNRQQLPKLPQNSITICFKDILQDIILEGLKKKQKLYNGILEIISKSIYATQILISDIELPNRSIYFEVFFNQSNFNIEQTKKTIKKEFIDQLTVFEQKFDFSELLTYLKIEDYQLEEQFQIILLEKSKVIMIGMLQSINQIKQYVNEMEEKKPKQSYTLQISNMLIFNKLTTLHQNKQLDLDEKTEISFSLEKEIILTAQKSKIQKAISTITKIKQDLENKLETTVSKFNEKEIHYIKKKLQSTISSLEKQHQCIIDFSQSSYSLKKSLAQQIIHSNKELSIVCADISKIECDAIVNCCNDKMSFGNSNTFSGVAQSIFEMAGNQFAQFCQDYILKSNQLKIGEACAYQMPQGGKINYILNVTTPIYQSSKYTRRDLDDIKKNIIAIFKEADKLYVKSLAIPILGAGACGYSFQDAAITVINEVINQLFTNQYSIKTVYLTELFESRVTRLTEIMRSLVNPPKEIRKIKYQWQWQDGASFKDYDDEDINRQIDEAFELFQKQGTKKILKLKFPYSKQPGTHTVNLQKGIIQDDSLKTVLKVDEKTTGNANRFYINNQQIDDQLNEYLTLQKINQQNQFSIFYKQHSIIFTPQENYQINEVTQYKRLIKYIPYTKENSQNQLRNILQDKQIQIKNFQFENFQFSKKNQSLMTIQSFSEVINKQILQILETELKKDIIQFQLTVPNLQKEYQQEFQNNIQSKSIKIMGQFSSGNTITLEIFKYKEPKIQEYLAQINKSSKQYPLSWQPQNSNFVKILLNVDTQEYKKISQNFKQTDLGQIYAIYRIQNKLLWDNYIREKTQLIEKHRLKEQILTEEEQERFLWHGVKGSNPNVIYSDLNKGFDQTYSKIGMWGSGIYFAENASYSRNFSYKLTEQEDKNYAGKLIFLCCLVTTGKVEKRNPDPQILRPSTGFDCVSGETNGSKVFILYSMDIRRAYPTYEVIYS